MIKPTTDIPVGRNGLSTANPILSFQNLILVQPTEAEDDE